MRICGIALLLLLVISLSLSAQKPDGPPNVEGAWRPVSGGTHSLDPALSSAQEFEQRTTGVIKRNPSFVVDPPDGHIPYQPWAKALKQKLEASYENPTRPEQVDTQTRCLVPSIPRLYYFPTFRIIQPPGSVVFVWDEYHTYREVIDRKSTRLNSSHGYISYAVFCL